MTENRANIAFSSIFLTCDEIINFRFNGVLMEQYLQDVKQFDIMRTVLYSILSVLSATKSG